MTLPSDFRTIRARNELDTPSVFENRLGPREATIDRILTEILNCDHPECLAKLTSAEDRAQLNDDSAGFCVCGRFFCAKHWKSHECPGPSQATDELVQKLLATQYKPLPVVVEWRRST